MQILDRGSNTYVINNLTRSRFKVKSIPLEIKIIASNGILKAIALGTIQLNLKSPSKKTIALILQNVLYILGFYTNLVALFLTRKISLFLDKRDDY